MGRSADKIRKGAALTRPTTTHGHHNRPNLDSKGNFISEMREVYNNNSGHSNRNQLKGSAPQMLVLSNDKGGSRYVALHETRVPSTKDMPKK